MGIFDRFRTTQQKAPEMVEGYQSFSTPFLNIGAGNLSLPYVNGRNQTTGWIPFGDSNLFPSVLNQLVYSSPLHGSIVDYKTNAVVGGGIELKTTTTTPLIIKLPRTGIDQPFLRDRPRFKDLC
jgi:hypothetical protein